jgi:hypothetical protein
MILLCSMPGPPGRALAHTGAHALQGRALAGGPESKSVHVLHDAGYLACKYLIRCGLPGRPRAAGAAPRTVAVPLEALVERVLRVGVVVNEGRLRPARPRPFSACHPRHF